MRELAKNVAKKITWVAMLILLFFGLVRAQIGLGNFNTDSLITALGSTQQDSNRVATLLMLAESYYFNSPPTSLRYSTDALHLARKLNLKKDIARALVISGECLRQTSNYPRALRAQIEAMAIYHELNLKRQEASSYGFIGLNYYDLGKRAEAIPYLRRALDMSKGLKPIEDDALFYTFLGATYSSVNKFDSAFYFIDRAKARATEPVLISRVMLFKGFIFQNLRNSDSAFFYFKKALSYSRASQTYLQMSGIYRNLSEMFDQRDQPDSSLYYATRAVRLATTLHQKARLLESSRLLSKHFKKKGQLDSALYYADIASAMTDSVYGKEKFAEWQQLVLQEQKRGQEIQQGEERLKNRMMVIGLSSFASVAIFAGLVLYRSYKAKHKSNLALEKSLLDLKSAQSQLVQSEKMASLGELTAGIAHEIQNPLNFVNNFSEVNKDLLVEMSNEIKKGNLEAVKSIAKDVIDNQEKINHHGKRADSIVKGMLQHSRNSTGQKELTDINTLCDEYLRLAYHGLRAKDKSFNAKFETDFDQSLPQIMTVPQEIGRVILNLINNAFYAANEKIKLQSSGSNFQPLVIVTTKNLGDKIQITVRDNGMGVPQKIKEKIFQPFFTTKPSGQGTGLGLSLAYEIITKGHGGSLQVKSEEGKFTEFTIGLNSNH